MRPGKRRKKRKYEERVNKREIPESASWRWYTPDCIYTLPFHAIKKRGFDVHTRLKRDGVEVLDKHFCVVLAVSPCPYSKRIQETLINLCLAKCRVREEHTPHD
jgi:hypothetical protein